ncbi:MAG: hypothetical protein ACTHNN_17230 [Xanthobacteraceae bacterium]
MSISPKPVAAQGAVPKAQSNHKRVQSLRDRDRWLAAAIASPDLGNGDSRVATRLALHFNIKTGQCNPNYETLAAGTAQTITAIPKQLKRLEDAGFLQRISSRGRHANSYDLFIPGSAEAPAESTRNQRYLDRVGTRDRDTLFDLTTTDSDRPTADSDPCEPYPAIHTNREENKEKNNERDIYIADVFENFWKQYPRKVDKGAARKAFERALKRVSLERIMAGVLRYASERTDQDPKFTKHAATWLNHESWDNEPLIRQSSRRSEWTASALAGIRSRIADEDLA